MYLERAYVSEYKMLTVNTFILLSLMKKYLDICKTTENKWEVSQQPLRHFGTNTSQPHKP